MTYLYPLNRPVAPANSHEAIGIELEIEGRNLPNERDINIGKKFWTTHRDGSLRGENFEYILDKPIKAEEISEAIARVYSAFAKRASALTLSNRCSTHVHYNIGGTKINEVTCMIVLWTTFEKALVDYCGDLRKTNHFCLSSFDSPDVVEGWATALDTGYFTFPEEQYKYASLNLATIRKFGSLEVRTMRASEAPQEIIDWTKFIYALFEYAKRIEDPVNIAGMVSADGPLSMFQDIYNLSGASPAFYREVVKDVDTFVFDCLQSFRNAQRLCFDFDWAKMLPLTKEKYIENPFAKETAPRRRREVPPPVAMEAIRVARVQEIPIWATRAPEREDDAQDLPL